MAVAYKLLADDFANCSSVLNVNTEERTECKLNNDKAGLEDKRDWSQQHPLQSSTLAAQNILVLKI